MDKQEHPQEKPQFEGTLSEFPITLLHQKASKDVKHVQYLDVIRGEDGKPIPRTWTVYGDPALGFGSPTIIGTLFELFQVWAAEGFIDQKIAFGSIYRLIERKGLRSKGKENYKRIDEDLTCLAGLEFDAQNAYWNPEKKAYENMKRFKLFDYVKIYSKKYDTQEPLPFSYIQASKMLWKAAKKGSFLPLTVNRTLFHSLGPLAQKLCLYLDKMWLLRQTNPEGIHRRDMLQLAKQLPIDSDRPSNIRKIFRRICYELISKGYTKLEAYEIEKSPRRDTENILFMLAPRPKRVAALPDRDEYQAYVDVTMEDILEVTQDDENINAYRKMVRTVLDLYGEVQLIHRAIAETKEQTREAKIHKSKGAYLTFLVKKYMEEDGHLYPPRRR